jgi:hypothetical protein
MCFSRRYIWKKFHLPEYYVTIIAHFVLFFVKLWSKLTGTLEHKVSDRLKFNPFSEKMYFVNRTFDISAAERDLKYRPILSFASGWAQTIAWFKDNWLPKFKQANK